MVPAEMYGEKYGELAEAHSEKSSWFIWPESKTFSFQQRKIKEWEKYEKESVCVPFEARDI